MPYAVIILLEISEVNKHKPELCMQLHINVYSSDKNRAFLKVTNNITTPTCYPGTEWGIAEGLPSSCSLQSLLVGTCKL